MNERASAGTRRASAALVGIIANERFVEPSRLRSGSLRARFPVLIPVTVILLLFLALATGGPVAAALGRTGGLPGAGYLAPFAVGWSGPTALTDGSASDRRPSVALDPLGQMHLVYLSGSPARVLYRSSVDGGASWSGPIEISSDAADARPVVAADGSGAAVVWVAADKSLFFRPVVGGAPGTAEQVASNVVSSPAVAKDAAGRVHVAYHYWLASSLQVLHRIRVTAWGDITNLSEIEGTTDGVSLFADSTGGVNAAWAEFVANTWEVAERRFDGLGWGIKQNVSSNSSFSLYPAVTSDASGTARVAWLDETVKGMYSVLFREQSGANFGTTAAPDLPSRLGFPPAIGVDAGGTSHVIASTRSGNDILYSAGNSGGFLPPLGLSDGAGVTANPALFVDARQFVHAFWDQANSGGNSRIMYSRRLTAFPTPTATATPIPPTPTRTPVPPSNLPAPNLLSPVQGVTLTSSQVDFRWTVVTGASRYRLEYSTSNTFPTADTAVVDTANSFYTAVLTRTNDPRQWFWRVSSFDAFSSLSVIKSATERFVIPGFEPPKLQFPPNGYTFIVPGDPVQFQWGATDGAESYLLEIGTVSPAALSPQTNGRFQTSAILTTTVVSKGKTGWSSPGSGADPLFENNRTYYWHVASLDASGNIRKMSETRSFQKTFPAPVPISPQDSFDVPYVDVTFEWRGVTGASAYDVEVYPYTDFVNRVYAATVVSTKHTPTRSLPDDEYWWRIRARDGSGVPGGWSDLRRFKRVWQAAPQLLEPVNGAGVRFPIPPACGDTVAIRPAQTVYLRWKSVSRASRYHVKLTSIPDDLTQSHVEIDVQVARTDWAPTKGQAAQLLVAATYFWQVWALDDTTASASGIPRANDPNVLIGPPSELRSFRIEDPECPYDSDGATGPLQPLPAFQAAGNLLALRTAPDRYDTNGVPVYAGIPPAITWREINWSAYCPFCGHEFVDYYAISAAYDENVSNKFNSGVRTSPNETINPSYQTRALAFTPVDAWPDTDANRGYFVTTSAVFTTNTTTGINPSVYDVVAFNKVTPPGPLLELPTPQQIITDVPTFRWRELTKVDPGMNKTDSAPLFGYYNPNTTQPFWTASDKAVAASIDTTGQSYSYPIRYYVLQVASDPDFKSVVLTSTTSVTSTTGLTSTTVVTTTAVTPIRTDATTYTHANWTLPNGVYYWRVCAVPFAGSDGCDDQQTTRMSWSETRTFFYIKSSQIVVVSGQELGGSSGSLMRWQPLLHASSYEVQIAVDSDFLRVVDSATTQKVAYSPTTPLPSGLYQWRVRARFDDGSVGAWSSPQNMTIAAGTDYRSYLPLVISGGSGGW